MSYVQAYGFIGNGVASIAETDETTGNPKDFDFLGNVTSASIGYSKNRVDRRNYQLKGNPYDKSANITTDSSISLVTNDVDIRISKRYFGGQEFSIPAAAVANEPLGLSLTDSKWATGINSGGIVEDATLTTVETNLDLAVAPVLQYGTPGNITTAVPATAFTFNRHGQITIDRTFLAGLTAADATAWAISYTHRGIAAGQGLAVGNEATGCTKRLWLKIEGNNLAECGAGEYQTVDIYKVVLTPDGDVNLIGEDYSELTFSGMVLSDPTRPQNGQWDQYFRIRRFGE